MRQCRNSKFIMMTAVLAFLAMMMIGGSGCMSVKSNSQERAYEHLSDRYNDVFSDPKLLGKNYDSSQVEYCFTSEKYPNGSVWVSVNSDGTVMDNYLNVKYNDAVHQLIDDVLTEAFEGNKFYFEKNLNMSHTCIEDSSDGVTFEDFISRKESILQIQAFVGCDRDNFDKEFVFEKVKKAISERGACFVTCNLYFTSDDEISGLADSMDERDIFLFKEEYDYCLKISMNETDDFSDAEWIK